MKRKKKARGDSATPTLPLDLDNGGDAQPQPETQEVKEVTKGVQEVDLQGETAAGEEEEGEVTALEPESVPLPEETSPGELDEPGSDASTPPPTTEVVDDEETSDALGPIDASETVPVSQKLGGTEEGHANTVEGMTVTTEEDNANKVEETK